MKINKKHLTVLFLLLSTKIVAQFVIINITWHNTDKGLYKILGQKLAINAAIQAQQVAIHLALTHIRNNKIKIRRNDYERNTHDKSLAVPLATNLAVNNLILGLPLLQPNTFGAYFTAQKTTYFARELLLNDTEVALMALVRNNNIRNANTQELYTLNRKMLQQLKKTNKNAHKNAAFVLGASLLVNAAANINSNDFDTILSLNLGL